MSAPAEAQAMEALLEAHAAELKLPTVNARFRALPERGYVRHCTPQPGPIALLEAEVLERSERRERRRLIEARFPLIEHLEDFRFEDKPQDPTGVMGSLLVVQVIWSRFIRPGLCEFRRLVVGGRGSHIRGV
jgi:DNA replication protein DnaC